MLSIADTLKAKNIPFELHYVFALMSPDSFRATIEASAFAENTMFYKESSEDNQLLKPATVLADRPQDTQLFICGVDWWQDPIIALAKQKGFAEERIHVERFTAKAAAALLDKVFEVKIASTGATFKIPATRASLRISRRTASRSRPRASKGCAAPARPRWSKARSSIATSACLPTSARRAISCPASHVRRATRWCWICDSDAGAATYGDRERPLADRMDHRRTIWC